MKNIKSFDGFNESTLGNFIRDRVNKDEGSGRSIIDKIEEVTKGDIFKLKVSKSKSDIYTFELSNVEYQVDSHSISEAGKNLNLSNRLIKTIFEKVRELYNLQNSEGYSGPLGGRALYK